MKRRSQRYNTRRSRNRSGNIGKTLAVAAIPLALALGGTALMVFTGGEEAIDAQFCYHRTDQHRHAIFIDSSIREHSEAQLRDYRTALQQAYEKAPANSRLMIFTTAADTHGSLAKPVYEQCKPAATVAQQEAVGAPSKPAPYLHKQYSKANALYHQATEQVLRNVQDSSKHAMTSPILEQLRSISHYEGLRGSGSRQFTVITDGIQNSMTAQFCQVKGHMPSFEKFTQRRDYEISIKPRAFTGADISLLMMEAGSLPNVALPYCTNAELKRWWYDYFIGNGAASVELTTLQYLSGAL